MRVREVEDVADQGTIRSEIRATVQNVEKQMHQMIQPLNTAQKPSDHASDYSRNGVVQESPELYMRTRRQRERAAGYHIFNLLQMTRSWNMLLLIE